LGPRRVQDFEGERVVSKLTTCFFGSNKRSFKKTCFVPITEMFGGQGMKDFLGAFPLSAHLRGMNFGAMNCKIFSEFHTKNKTPPKIKIPKITQTSFLS